MMDQITAQERKAILRGKWGDKIRIDELCTCGHRRSEHGESWPPEVMRGNPEIARSFAGHGKCLTTRSACACQKFTWKRTLFRSPRVRRKASRRDRGWAKAI